MDHERSVLRSQEWATDSVLRHMNPVHICNPVSLRIVLVLSSHICLGLPSGPFPSGFRTKTLHALPPLGVLHALAHFILLDWLLWE
jgi:hypothetical protein